MTAVADIPDPSPDIPDLPVQGDTGDAVHTTRDIQTPLQPVVDTPVYQETEENRQQDVGSEQGRVGTEG